MKEKTEAVKGVSGIYRITNRVTGESYVGLAHCIAGRWKAHLQSLRWGNHHSPRFQASYDEHGAESFDFTVLEICQRSDLRRRERIWIDRIHPALNQQTFSLYTPTSKSDVAAVLSVRASAKMLEARKRIASESGVASECSHCEERVTGKVICERCGEWLKHECQDCHNEVAHAVVLNHNLHFCGSGSGNRMRTVDADLDAYH